MASHSLPPPEASDDLLLKCVICSSTLNDPVLLNCLHSACRSCTQDATAEVTCVTCQISTSTSSAKTNFLVSSCVHRSQVLKSAQSCAHCIEEDKPDATAVAWCYACQISLCADYQRCHNKLLPAHKVIRLDENVSLSELCGPPLRSCTEHGEVLKLACFTCRDTRCLHCAHDCYTSSHDVQLLGGPSAAERMKSHVAAAASLLSDLKSTDISLPAYLSLPENVTGAMKESLAVLRNAKKTALDSISSAYDKAEESLVECWEILLSKAEHRRESAVLLSKRLDWTIEYCELALSAEDIGGLLPQLDAVGSRLRILLDDARLVKPPTDPLSLVSMNMCLPRDLDLIACDWLGKATLNHAGFDSQLNDSTNDPKKMDYYIRKVSSLNELDQILERQREEQKRLQEERQSIEQLLEKQKEEQKRLQEERQSIEQLLWKQTEEASTLKRERLSLEQLNQKHRLDVVNLQRERTSLEQLTRKQTEELKNLQKKRQRVEQLTKKQQEERIVLEGERTLTEHLVKVRQEEQTNLQRVRQSVEQVLLQLRLGQSTPSQNLSFASPRLYQ